MPCVPVTTPARAPAPRSLHQGEPACSLCGRRLAHAVRKPPTPTRRAPCSLLGTCGVPGMGGLPVFLSGISMGGCVAVRAALREPDRFRGLILLAPMLSLEHVSRKGLNPYIRPLARLLSLVCPSAAIVATDRNTMYPTLQDLWDAGPSAQLCLFWGGCGGGGVL